ncbi:MAG: stage sporulation protein, partial [Paenibacillus sp.]|nr:stage sporulation protein [Paenibacillus sp.]
EDATTTSATTNGGGKDGGLAQAAAAAIGNSELEGVNVRVYLSDSGKVEKVPIETYVMGVLAGEMPIDFELEAMKAQAIAARTYIVRRLASGLNELASRGADVSDTVQHQVYISKKELAGRWAGEEKKANLEKLERAVRETRGLVVTYEGQPIEAAFFSTSNGFTENSEDYWTSALPYLRSVDSPWDKELSPRYEQQTTFKVSQFYSAMGLSGKAASAKKPSMKVADRTDGNRIKSLRINGKTFAGREVRERLGLASSEFSWKISKGSITFTTYGLGHGVGMSQWGANGLAKAGGSAADILLHYYTGTKVEQASKLPAR